MNLETLIAEYFAIPEKIQKLANMANNDLYNGPTYLDGEGNVCSMFDQVEGGVTAFNFTEACASISDWCGDNIVDMFYDEMCGCVVEQEPTEEQDEDGDWIEPAPYVEVDSHTVRRILFGGELASHI